MDKAQGNITSNQRELVKTAELLRMGVDMQDYARTLGIGLQSLSPTILAEMKAMVTSAVLGPTLMVDVLASAEMDSIRARLAAEIKGLDMAAMQNMMSVAPLHEAIQHMVQSQQMASSLVGAFAELSKANFAYAGIETLLASNNALIANSLASINHIGVLSDFSSLKLDALLYGGVSDDILEVTRTFGRLFAPSEARDRAVVADRQSPAIATSSYASSLSFALDSDSEPMPNNLGSVVDRLDEHLMSLDPGFVNMRRGAWDALASSNPDRCRHAAISHRELFRRVLQRLAPDVRVDIQVRGSKIKGRIKQILGGSESSAEFVVAVSGASFALYEFLSKPTHADFSNQEAVRGALMTGEGLLLFIFEERVP
jgi:hypothetical protein